MPVSGISNDYYTGGNAMMLMLTQMEKEYSSNVWGTYNYWCKTNDYSVKGQKGTPIYYYSKYQKENATGDIAAIPFMKVYYVWNSVQVDGYKAPGIEKPVMPNEAQRIANVDAFVKNTGANIVHEKHGRAFYRPSTDHIEIPEQAAFKSTNNSSATENMYATILHELVHWTGAKKRLDRLKNDTFGDSTYAFEELVAEFGSSFLCNTLNITNTPRIDHAQYLNSWLKVLKNNKTAARKAASLAWKAVAYCNELQQKTAVKQAA